MPSLFVFMALVLPLTDPVGEIVRYLEGYALERNQTYPVVTFLMSMSLASKFILLP